MGDRGNIVMLQHRGGERPVIPETKEAQEVARALQLYAPDAIFFYTHWSGSEIAQTLQAALKYGKARWGDEAYLARIIFQRLVGKDVGETGFGISTSIGDNEHNLLVVDDQRRVVGVAVEERPTTMVREMSYADFCGLDAKALQNFFEPERGAEDEG